MIGAPGDVPRALQHPAVLSGQFAVQSIVAIDVDAEDRPGSLLELARTVAENGTDTILVAGPVGAVTMRRVADLALLRNCALLAVMPTEVLTEHDPVVVWSGDSPLVELARHPRKSWQATAKRVLDFTGALVGLILASPVLAILSALICIESPGAPIFRHDRVGLRGRRFNCLKLRTMRADAEAQLRTNPELLDEYRRNHFKIPEDRDPRVTRLGRFLRRTSLDELPQLWNVLVGDMSLVGPRPIVEEELAAYESSRELLLSVRPGITGAWAVGGRHSVGYPERCEMELSYVREWSIRRDVDILAATLSAVFSYSSPTPPA